MRAFVDVALTEGFFPGFFLGAAGRFFSFGAGRIRSDVTDAGSTLGGTGSVGVVLNGPWGGTGSNGLAGMGDDTTGTRGGGICNAVPILSCGAKLIIEGKMNGCPLAVGEVKGGVSIRAVVLASGTGGACRSVVRFGEAASEAGV